MTDLALLDAPDDLKQNVSACVLWSQANTVTDAPSFQATATHLQNIKVSQKLANEFFDPPIKQAYDLHKMLVGRKKLLTGPLEQSESLDKQKMLNYQRAEQEKAAAEQRRLQAIADADARKERERLEKLAAAAKKPETQQRYAEAAASVAPAPVVHVASAAPKVAGLSTRTIWRCRVIDPMAIPREFLMVDEAKLAGYAKSMKEMARVAGCEFYPDQSLASKAG